MRNPRKYGEPPYAVAVVHGGPGAVGEMAPVARELASNMGVLEPLQTQATLEDQVEELGRLLRSHAALPVTLIGYSWGAWLGVLLAARDPELIKKLILVGSGPFEPEYAGTVEKTRLSRLTQEERGEVRDLLEIISDPAAEARETAFERFGRLYSKVDTYEALPAGDEKDEKVELRPDIFEAVWPEGAELRRSGLLLDEAGRIGCPVVAIHGDHDPHPAEGVRRPLAARLADFHFILLKRCGHKPWIERHARAEFYRVLGREIG
ncbi:MAG: alpha/beta hydrolase [bacterium]